MLKLKKTLKTSIYQALKDEFPLEYQDIDLTYPPQIEMGDLALAFPFQLAKKMKTSPRTIAQEASARLHALEGIERVEIAGAGYINLFLDRKQFFSQHLLRPAASTLTPETGKTIVEHTSINPNKAAHIGHIRNACLGDTLVRCLSYKGDQIEIQNYIDDTGVQVADVAFGFMELEKKSLEDIRELPGKFDDYCWDLYARVAAHLDNNPEAGKRKSEILKKIEKGLGPEYDIAHHVSRRILKAHLETMGRLGITYDLQACESHIIKLDFWKNAFSLLKEKGAVVYAGDGAHKGCWVMKLQDGPEQEKIIVRSDETVTYVGKDIAYQLWKFGLLDKDFFYTPFVETPDHTIWITSSSPTGHHPGFGKAGRVYNVIDIRQAYPQKVVTQGLKSLQYTKQAGNSIHFSYEMVALSPQSLKELGQQVTAADREKNFMEVSGRKGLGIKANDLIDRMEKKARDEVDKRNPGFSTEEKLRVSRKIACGALRYFMLKFARNSIIIFDFEDALSFEGETGPYLQYSLVRINSILRKLKKRLGIEPETLLQNNPGSLKWDLLSGNEYRDFWDTVLYASKLDEEVLHSLNTLEFLHLAKFTFNLCQKFNAYYHKYSILAEDNPGLRDLRILTIYFIQKKLETALNLMGIPQPERM
ncbi:MAG: arginine--tRNA ligase [Candidatus Aminicenantes bacterium]